MNNLDRFFHFRNILTLRTFSCTDLSAYIQQRSLSVKGRKIVEFKCNPNLSLYAR